MRFTVKLGKYPYCLKLSGVAFGGSTNASPPRRINFPGNHSRQKQKQNVMSKKNKSSVSDITEPVERVTGPAPSAFLPRAAVKRVEGVTVKSMSPMLKPINWPKIDGQNAVLVGVFTKTFATGDFKEGTGKNEITKKGTGVEIVPQGAPVGIGLPVTTTLRTGLDITGDGKEATSPYLGRTVEIELMPERIKSKKGQAAWHFLIAIYPADYSPDGTAKKSLK